jgi:hypothetical protein
MASILGQNYPANILGAQGPQMGILGGLGTLARGLFNPAGFGMAMAPAAQRAAQGMVQPLMQANQAMPWGGNDPTAIGIDPQAGTIDPSVMVPFASNVAGMATTGSMAGPAVPGAAGMGIRAYHGSPHDFDRFSMDKIGTGEGAQAYGHGLYFAENPSVAGQYKDNLATYKHIRDYNDANPKDRPGQVAQWWASGMDLDRVDEALKVLEPDSTQAMRDEWIKKGQALHDEMASRGRMYEVDIDASPDEFLDWDKPLSEQPEAIQDAIKSTETYKHYLAGNEAGRMQHPDTYPGSRWISFLQDEAARVDEAMSAPLPSALPDSRASWRSSSTSGLNVASDILHGKGIKGIRYNDAGSRSPDPLLDGKPIPDGDTAAKLAAEKLSLYGSVDAALQSFRGNVAPYAEGFTRKAEELIRSGRVAVPTEGATHNYVVFDENTINILKKYGLAGLTAGGGAALALGGSDPASAEQPSYSTARRF